MLLLLLHLLVLMKHLLLLLLEVGLGAWVERVLLLERSTAASTAIWNVPVGLLLVNVQKSGLLSLVLLPSQHEASLLRHLMGDCKLLSHLHLLASLSIIKRVCKLHWVLLWLAAEAATKVWLHAAVRALPVAHSSQPARLPGHLRQLEAAR